MYDKTKCSSYCQELSIVGHREETIFTHEIFRRGYKLVIDPSSIIWHYRNPEGGIREKNVNQEMFDKDEVIFRRKMSSWNINVDKNKILVLAGGIGDCYAFKNHLGKLLERVPDLIIATFNTKVFEDVPNLKLIPAPIACDIMGKEAYEKQNIYGWAARNNWKPESGNLVRMYEVFLSELFPIF